jgi:hypothetical protein
MRMFLGKQKRSERRMTRDVHALVLLDGFAKRDCKIVDISDKGARLAINSTTPLPRCFSIAFASSTKPCELVWRNGAMAGVKFLK